ncbi:hypothetical protein [Micromonospora chersina]|uniref:Uncharacterized protein n=1 Tax=Micromonospora chersina TaxID=47854 RepID=A0A1C6U8C9_9ACTN|nr:hypothetical protein [Micromonospora chersina]SCL50355.1 hypothetical protein GA0070603_0967 [Micromonospora chersina]
MPTPLLLARILLGIQALILSSITLLVVQALFQADPELRSPWQDLLLGAATVGPAALAITAVIRLGAPRPWSWTAAVSAHLVALTGYGWFMFQAMTADVPEGMLFFSAVVVGTPLVLLSVAGLVLLLVPGSVKHGFGRRAT